MLRINRSFVLVPVLVALGVLVAGCGTSSTGPQSTPSAYAGSYNGIFDGAGVSGTATATVGQVSADMTRGPVLHAEGGSNAVTVTLATETGSITLTGTISGNTATVTSTAPPATCTIMFTTTGATGSCTEAPYGTFPLVLFVIVNGIEATTYCGTQSAGAVATVSPTATLGAVVSGPNMYLIVAAPTGTPTLYSGTLASNSVSLTSTSSGGAVYSGTETGSGASIGGTITSGGSGSWSVVNPCTQGSLTVSTNAVPASASVGSTTTITPTPVTITNGGGSATLGVLAVGAPAYNPSATSGWLQATLTSPTTTGGTLALSITPPSGIAAGTYTAAVPVTASLGTGSPQTVTVTLTITAGVTITSTSPLPSWVDLIQFSDQLTATGGSGTYTWSLASGSSLPAWLSLSPSGLLSGAAPAGTAYPANTPLTFSVTATDGTTSATKQFQIVVFTNVTITSPATLPNGYFGSTYCCVNGYQLTATGGPTSNYGWAVSAGSALPSWLSLSTGGVLSGVPPVGATTPVSFFLTVASGGSTAAQRFTITIYPVLLFSAADLGFTMNQGAAAPALQTINLTGRGGAVSGLAATIGYPPAPAPQGWLTATINPTTTPTTLSVQPTAAVQSFAAGTYTALISVSSSVPGSLPGVVTVTLTVSASSTSCTITTTTLGVLTVGTAANVPLTYTGAGCPTPFNFEWVVSPGLLPAGLEILPDENAVTGTPTMSGNYVFTLEMVSSIPGAVNPVATQPFAGEVSPAAGTCSISPLVLVNGTVGATYNPAPSQVLSTSSQCTTTNDDPTGWAWTLGAGAPAGLSLHPGGSSTTTTLEGTPTGNPGTYTFTIEFQESVAGENGTHNATATNQYIMTIAPAAGGAGVVRTAAAPKRSQ
jgi:large repetitive protein